LADTNTRLTQAGNILGTPEFMSPEQARGRTDIEPRSDLYSLGATMYFALAGQPPFVRKNLMETLFAHHSEPVVPLTTWRADVPADGQAVVLRCLAKDPGERFPDARSLESALSACACAADWGDEQANSWWEAHRDLQAAPEPRPTIPTTDSLPTRAPDFD